MPLVVAAAIGIAGVVHLAKLRKQGAAEEQRQRVYSLYFSIFLFISESHAGFRNPAACALTAT
jgi:hypothetical protein